MSELPVPQRIHRGEGEFVVTWEPSHVSKLAFRRLRQHCHCATCRDEFTGRVLFEPGAIPSDIRPVSVALVGNYAIKIGWSDGHDTGIYTYEYLLQLCQCDVCLGGTRARGTGLGEPPDR